MATVAVEVSPGQSVMYPLCPYQAAWKPGVPEGTLAGGGMPGPTLEVHGAAVSDCWLARTGTPRVRAHTTSATLANTPPTRVLIRAIATQHAVCLGALDDRPPVLSKSLPTTSRWHSHNRKNVEPGNCGILDGRSTA